MGYTRLNPKVAVEQFTSASYTVAANGYQIVDFTVTKTGYTFLGIVGFGGTSNGAAWTCGYAQRRNATTARLVFRNVSGASVTDTFWVRCLYVKS